MKYAAAIVLALGVYALWSIGEPSRQAERAKKAIHTGMSIAEVEGVLTYDRIFRRYELGSGADSKNVSAEEFAKALTPPAQGGGQSSSGRLYGRAWDKANARKKELYLEWWTKELGLTTLADVDLPRVEKAIQRLQASGLAPKSVALRVESLRCLCIWAMRRGLLPDNPLRGMGRLDIRPRLPHRTLADEEVAALLKVAPPKRRLAYEVALQTGFRVNELRHLTVASLDVFGPSLHLNGDFTKNRRDARQPITREMADRLARECAGKPPEAGLLDLPKDKAWRQFKKDCRAAGVRKVTPEGLASWHSLRKVFVNAVVRSGADLKTVMELARHSSATLSMETYASAKPALLRAAAEAAAGHLKKVVDAPPWCAGGAQQAAGGKA